MSQLAEKDADLLTLLKEIAHDSSTLITQQMELVRTEVGKEMRKASLGLVELAAGGGLAAAGGILSGMMAAHLLREVTHWPLWVCYGCVGGGVSAVSATLLKDGLAALGQLRVPPESTEAIKENVRWLHDQLEPTPTT